MPISRRQFLTASSAVLAAWPTRGLLARQQPAAPPPQTSFQLLRRDVGIFTGRGGTIGWLSSGDALVVVDTQYADTATICLDGLPGRGGRTIDRVFNTHHHADHTGGNSVFRAAAAKIVAQQHVPALQRTAYATTSDPQVYADSTFGDTWSERLGHERVTATFNGPGHTGGDAIVHFEHADIVHLGDLLWIDVHPFVDRPGGALNRELDEDSRTGLEAHAREHDLHRGTCPTRPAGYSRPQGTSEAARLFRRVPRLSLAATLGAAYDELTSAPRQ